jgi:hypothetical protein
METTRTTRRAMKTNEDLREAETRRGGGRHRGRETTYRKDRGTD